MTAIVETPAFNPNSFARLARLSLARTVIELKTFFRTPEQVFFTFLLPVLFVVIFSTIFSGEIEGGPPGSEPVEFAQYFVPGRDVSAHDMAANAIGVAIGSTVGSVIFSVLQGLLRPLRSR